MDELKNEMGRHKFCSWWCITCGLCTTANNVRHFFADNLFIAACYIPPLVICWKLWYFYLYYKLSSYILFYEITFKKLFIHQCEYLFNIIGSSIIFFLLQKAEAYVVNQKVSRKELTVIEDRVHKLCIATSSEITKLVNL